MQESLCICERAFLFRITGSWKKENFRLDVLRLQFAPLHLRGFAPEVRRFNLDHLTDDQPFQFRQCFSLQPRIRRSDGWVLPHQKHAFHVSVEHVVEVLKERVVTGKFGKPTVAEIVLGDRTFTVISLECAHQVLRVMRPETALFGVMLEVLLNGLIAFPWHCQITGKNVVKGRNISRTLDGSVTAQGENSAARTADVSKQQLQNRRGTNDLHAFGMLRPSHGVTNCRRPFRAGRRSERMRNFVKEIGRNAANFLDHLRRIPGEMPLQLLKNTLRILQCEIPLRTTQIIAFIQPAVTFVSALLCVPTGEMTIAGVLRVAVVVAQNARGIGVMHYVIAKEEFVLN